MAKMNLFKKKKKELAKKARAHEAIHGSGHKHLKAHMSSQEHIERMDEMEQDAHPKG